MQRVRRILATAVLMVTSVVSVMPSKPALASDVPSTPDPVVVGTVTATSAAVAWAPPASDGGSAITSYELYVSGTRVAKIPSHFYTIGGLAGGATYNITLKACNLVGCSPETDAVSVVTMPSAATGLKAVVGSESLTLTWIDSTSPDVTTHSIWYRPSTTLSWTEWTPGEEDASGTTITGLTNGTTYAVRVRVVAPQGVTDTATVLATPMAAPSTPSLSYSNVSQSSLVLAWTTPAGTGATPAYYEVYRDGARIATTTLRYFSATGLTPLQTYSFTVKACNSTGCSPASSASTVTLPPPPPSRQAAAAVDTKIVVTWLNSPVADYHSVWYKLSTDTVWTEWTPGAADSSPTELTGLPGGVTYNIRIGAHGTDGQAAYSPIVNVVPFAAPSAPYSLRQLVAGASTASVTWIAPSNGGTPITGYKVFVDGGLYSEPSSTATSVSFSNLEIGARYVITIQACNLIGCSPASTPLPIFTVPVGPTAVAVIVGPTTAAVTWTASTSAFVAGYKIFFRRSGTSTWVEFTPQSDDPSGTVVSSLLVSTPYELYVRAYNPRGFADSPVTTFNTQGYQVPTEPTGLSAVATSGGARLSWTAPSWNGAAAITDYLVEWSSDNGSTWTSVQRAASNLTTATVTGLTAGVSYKFRVSAKNVAGFSNPSAPSAAVAPFSTPSAPLALAVTVGDKEMTLSWTAPSDNGSSAISDYIIQYSSNNGTYWSVFSDGVSSATTATVTGLTNGTSYVFRVAAVNSAGQGLWSASSTAAVPVTAPSAPTRVTVFPGTASVRVAWAVPASNGGTSITDYTVQYSLDDGANWTTAQDGVSNLTSANVTGLTNGSVYVFRVAAVNSFSSGPWSEVSLPASPRSPADPPTNLTGIALDGKISLSWTAPVSSGGTPVVDYQVSISSNNGGTWRVVSDLSSPTTTALITGLTNGVPYLFKVAAVTSAGPGALSAASAALTPRGAPSAPQLVVARLGDRQAPLTWQAPLSDGGTPITDYVVQYSSDDGANWTTFDDGIGTSTAITVTGLTNGLTYIFRVKASNAASPGPFSLNSSPLLLLSISQPPRNLAGTPGAESVLLTWDVPVDNGGSAINDYSVLYSSNGGKTWTSFAHTFSTDTNITVTGLTNGTAYSFKVAAMTSIGAGIYETLAGTVTPRTTPGVPTALSGVFGNKSAVLSWTAPTSNGGNAISDYQVQYSSNGGTSWTTFAKANPSAQTTVTVTGLTNGTTYVFRIAAQNAAGAGSWTAASDPVLPRAPATKPLNAAGSWGDRSVDLTWDTPEEDGGASITDYTVQFSTNGTTWTTFSDGVSAGLSATVTGLTNGTAYYFRVAAVTAYFSGTWSSTVGPVTPRAVPGAPTGVTGVHGEKSAIVSWTASTFVSGAATSDYVVQFSADSGSNWSTVVRTPSNATSQAVSNLANGVTYIFRVAAVNSVGQSAWSDVSPGVTPRAPATKPLNAAGSWGDRSVDLTWDTPEEDGGAPITDYTVQFSTNGTTWTTFSDGVSSSLSATVTGLTNGTAYYFRVAAVTIYGTGVWSSTVGPLTPRAVPGAPTGVTGVYGDTQVALSWTASTFVSGSVTTDYVVEYSSDSGSSWTVFSEAVSSATTATVTGLTNGTGYLFRVSAINAIGQGDWSAASASVTPKTNPGTPSGVVGTYGNASAALSWTAPADDGGSAVTDYSVQFSSNGGSTWSTFTHAASAASSITVTGLTNGTSYVFRVAAVNVVGAGSWSSASSAVVPHTVPGAPTSVTGTFGNTQVTLAWNAPSSNGGAVIEDYSVQFSSNGGSTWTDFEDGTSSATGATVTGLTNGTSYVFRVAAVNDAGRGSWSSNSTSVIPRTTPAAPTAVTPTYGNTQVTLSWTAPSDNGGAVISNYLVQYSSDAGSSWTSFTRAASSATSATVTGLTNGTEYVFRVAAVNSVGNGTWSDPSPGATPRTVPGVPRTLLGVEDVNQVALSWDVPLSDGGATVTDYRVQYSSNNGSTWTTFSDSVSTNTSATVTGLTNGTAYKFRVAAVNSEGTGSYTAASASYTPRSLPDAPTDLTATPGNTQVSITWVAPVDDGGSAISDYVIQYSTNGTTWTTFSDGVSTNTSATVTGLTNGTTYTLRVAAKNSAGAGATVSVSATPRTVPQAPASLAASADYRSADLTWSAPSSNGGNAITDYVVQFSDDGGSTWTTFTDGVSASLTASVTGLSANVSYQFRVAAVNAAGTGSWSSTATATPTATLSGPDNVSATHGDSLASLTWTAPYVPGDTTLLDYTIQYSSDSGSTWTTFSRAASTSTSATVTGLTNGTSYVFRVASVNSEGAGSWSATTTSVLVHAAPGAPTAVTPTYGNAQVALAWTAPSSNGGLAITDYVIQRSSNGGSSWTTFTDGTSTSTSATVTGLTNGTSYVFRVAAVNDAQGDWSATSAAATPRTTPNAPTGLSASYGNAQASLTWTAPSSNGGASITDYVVQYSSNSGSTWSTFADGTSTSTSATVTGLSNGTWYVFRVAAANSEGTGTSSSSSASVLPHTTPDAPTALSLTYGNTLVALSWTAPASNGGLAITDYVIQYSSNSGSTWTTFSRSASTSTSATVTGLTNGTSYVFRVAAVNDAQGSYSATSSSTTPRTTPNAPTSLSASYGNAQASLSWTASSDNGGATITDYAIQYSSNSGTSWTTFSRTASTSTSAIVTGLTNGTSYVFRVGGVNSEGTGTWSATSASVLVHTTPGAPTSVAGTYGDGQITVSWTAPASNGGLAITDYVLDVSTDGGSSWTTFADGTSTSTSVLLTGLTNGTAYVFRVAAVNDAQGDWSATSAAATPRTTPGAPTGVTPTYGNAQASLTWTAPTSNGGAVITDYTIQFSSNSGSTWSTFSDGTSTSTSTVVTGLTNGTSYVFRVAAVNSEGTGTWSATSASVLVRTSPGAPTAVTPTYGNTLVTLSWTAPASNGGLAITDYVIQYSSNSGSTWSTFADGTSTSTSAIVTGLTNGTSYVFRVAAVNDVQGSYSATSAASIPRTTPNTPSGLSATPGNAQASLSWTASSDNGGAVITDYVVQYSSNGGSSWTTFADGTSTTTSATVTGLSNGTAYVFRVAAVNSEGTGGYTPNASATPRTVPGAPGNISASIPNNTYVAVSFTAPASDGGSAITGYTATCAGSNGTNPSATGTGSPLNVTISNSGINYTCTVKANNAAGSSAASAAKTLTNNYVNPVYYCNGGDNPSGSSSSAFTCTVWTNHPYWVSTIYAPSCSLGGWDYAFGNNAGTYYYRLYTGNFYTSPYDGGSIVNTYRYWATSSAAGCGGQVVEWRWASSSCYSTSSGGTTGTCGATRQYRRIAGGVRTSYPNCHNGGPYGGDGWCYPNYDWGTGAWNTGYYADNWYWDNAYTSPLRAAGYWNGWSIT